MGKNTSAWYFLVLAVIFGLLYFLGALTNIKPPFFLQIVLCVVVGHGFWMIVAIRKIRHDLQAFRAVIATDIFNQMKTEFIWWMVFTVIVGPLTAALFIEPRESAIWFVIGYPFATYTLTVARPITFWIIDKFIGEKEAAK